jgi:23S rRNA (pseudouridine1915-N3)-methyltransferase
MQIEIIAVGKLKETYWTGAQQEYLKRLSRFAKIKVTEVEEEKLPENASAAMEASGKRKEGERILKALSRKPFTISLDLKGIQPDSQGLSNSMQMWMNTGKSDIAFVIGGSNGLDSAVLQFSDYSLCLSKLTFPHQLARVLLLEQIYRTFKILGNEIYHK